MKKLFVVIILAGLGCIAYSFITAPKQQISRTAVAVGTNIGNKAVDLKFKGPDGNEIALSSLQGKVVLLDFWASWCRPCRMENPHVVAAYEKFKDVKFNKKSKGFTIYSVSLDQNKDQWLKAIEADKLSWPYHVCDFGGWYSKAADVYGVQSIPTNFLINERGIIVGRDLRGADLEKALQALVVQ